MELNLKSNTMTYLKQSFCGSGNREETLEAIVPDSFPDVERILCCTGMAVTRGRELRDGCALLSGGVQAKILYMPTEGDCPRCLEMYLPYQCRVEDGKIKETGALISNVTMVSADARAIHSRKISLRVMLGYTVQVYEPWEETLFLPDKSGELQQDSAIYPMLLPAETAERTVQITEEVELARVMTGELYTAEPVIRITDRRVAGNKAVFKGLAQLRLIYDMGDAQIAEHTAEFPFSQYCDLSDTYEEEELEAYPSVAGFELEPISSDTGGGLRMNLTILVQCVLWKKMEVPLTVDAYCPGAVFTPQWKTCTFPSRLSHEVMHYSVRESRSGDIQEIPAAWTETGMPRIYRTGDSAVLSAESSAHILYKDRQGKLQHMTVCSTQEETITLAEDADVFVHFEVDGEVTAIPTGSGLELRYPTAMTVDTFAGGSQVTLCGGELEKKKEEHTAPSVIVRRARSGQRLWDIAKACGTTVEKIRKANGLQSDLTEDGVLLIPM